MTQKPRARGTQYSVGYGKPPTHTRFRPGQSGNPRGRRSAQASEPPPAELGELFAAILRVMDAAVDFTFKGKATRAKARDAVIKTILDASLDGDTKAARLLLDWTRAAETSLADLPRPPSAESIECALRVAHLLREGARNGKSGGASGAAVDAAGIAGAGEGAAKPSSKDPAPAPAGACRPAPASAGPEIAAPATVPPPPPAAPPPASASRRRGRGEPLIQERAPLTLGGLGLSVVTDPQGKAERHPAPSSF